MSKAQILLEILVALQGTPVGDFARANLVGQGDHIEVVCARRATLATPEGELCKRSIATALLRYSYGLNGEEIGVLAELYVDALDQLEPGAQVRVRGAMCARAADDPLERDLVAQAVCGRLSRDY